MYLINCRTQGRWDIGRSRKNMAGFKLEKVYKPRSCGAEEECKITLVLKHNT